MPAEAKKRVRAQLKQPREVKTIWERLEDDDVADPPVDVTGAIYPKRPKVSKQFDPYDLTKLPTKRLLIYLDMARAIGHGYNPSSNRWGREITVEELKAELAKRPHVPSKREGSALRRKKALGKNVASKIALRNPSVR